MAEATRRSASKVGLIITLGLGAFPACGAAGPPDETIDHQIRKVLRAADRFARTGESAMWIQGNRCLDAAAITSIAITDRRTYGNERDHVDVSFRVHTSAPIDHANCAPGERTWTGRIDFKEENGAWKPTVMGVKLKREAQAGDAPLDEQAVEK
jgi:hypothetical protein